MLYALIKSLNEFYKMEIKNKNDKERTRINN